ncbi:MAG TPA: DUF6084 family protein [Trebonia sp.]|nr:DUF6084 family protein [Trebonia sp.]
MAELTFGCTGAHAVRYAATPTFALSLNITENTGVRLHAIALRCQIRIEPHRRRYTADEARRLSELFGDTHSWGETAKPLQLATLTALVPGFTSRTEVELQVPCSYDLEVASARYLQVLEDGIIPLLLLFSGTVFVDRGHTYSVELIPWSLEVPFPMPVRVWHNVIDEHFPGSAWLRCSRETLGALAEFKSSYALSTWDDTLSALLAVASVPRDLGAFTYTVAGGPAGWDAPPEPWVTVTEVSALEPETAAREPEVAAARELEVAAVEPEAAALEPEAAAPEPEAAAPEPETEAPEPAVAAGDDAATEDTPPEDTPATAEDSPPEPQDAAPDPQDAAPAEAAPAEAASEERHTGIRRRRTAAAGRSTAGRRGGGGRAGGTP